VNDVQVQLPSEDSDCTSDLSHWYHCSNNRGIPDEILSKCWDLTENISFVFHHRSNSVNAEKQIAREKRLEEIRKKQQEEEEAEEELVDNNKENDSDDLYVESSDQETKDSDYEP
jgi:DNA repair and recombination RAD54-like protein